MAASVYAPLRGNKFHAKKVKTADGTFDSQKEYNRWCELKILERAGKIKNLRRQALFTLVPNQQDPVTNRVIERSVRYAADFDYIDAETGEHIVEDTKGYKTPDYIIKRKLMLYVKGIRIREL